LLTLEGFNFRLERGSIVTHDLSPYEVRLRINAALEKQDTATAWQLLDTYLQRLDTVSRDWFADGSPGDMGKWGPISRLDGVQTNGDVLTLHGFADGHSINLHLSLPKAGGVRIYGDNEGYFKPEELQPLNISQSADSISVSDSNDRIVVGRKEFSVSFY